MARLIHEVAIHVTEDGELESYWPEQWPMETLARRWRKLGSAAFAAGYQNDPSALEGNALKVDWVQFYLPEQLERAREEAGIPHGSRFVGIDPTRGGSGRDPDFTGGCVGERIGNRGFLLDFMNRRIAIERQAQAVEDWISLWEPLTLCVFEDTSAKGYVWNDLQQVNDGEGSRYPWVIEKAQGRNAVGAKEQRIMSMAPRFESGQVLVPGILTAAGEIVVDPRWEPWLHQWAAFPSGHDDMMDATYWCVFAMFGKTAPGGFGKLPTSRATLATPGILCEREAHLAYGKPVSQCPRCSSSMGDVIRSEPAIGERVWERPPGVGLGLRQRRW